jgi:hypothetical protein
MIVAVVEHELQAAHTRNEQKQTDDVDRRLHRLRFALVQQHPRDDGGEDAHRQVDVENPRP